MKFIQIGKTRFRLRMTAAGPQIDKAKRLREVLDEVSRLKAEEAELKEFFKLRVEADCVMRAGELAVIVKQGSRSDVIREKVMELIGWKKFEKECLSHSEYLTVSVSPWEEIVEEKG